MTKPTGNLDVVEDWGAFDYDFDGTRRWQIARGRSLTPAQRLQWLEETVAEVVSLHRRACQVDRPQITDGED